MELPGTALPLLMPILAVGCRQTRFAPALLSIASALHASSVRTGNSLPAGRCFERSAGQGILLRLRGGTVSDSALSSEPAAETTGQQDADLFANYGSAEQRQRFSQHWHQEEQQRAAAFDRLPPNPSAIPLAGDKLTERLLKLVHASAGSMQADLVQERALRRQRRLDRLAADPRGASSPSPSKRDFAAIAAGAEAFGMGMNGLQGGAGAALGAGSCGADADRGEKKEPSQDSTLRIFNGIERVSKALWKGPIGPQEDAILIMAADVRPFQRLHHLPIFCEERERPIPYIFIRHQYHLGVAARTPGHGSAAVLLLRPAGSGQETDRAAARFDRLHAKLRTVQHLAIPALPTITGPSITNRFFDSVLERGGANVGKGREEIEESVFGSARKFEK